MSTPSLRYDILADDKTAKGIQSAQKNISGLEKSVKDLGKVFGSVFAAEKVIAFGKASVKAFMEDEKSAALLSNTIKNLGLQFANTDIENFIKKLELTSGVVDEKLRPSMSKLLQVTGSVIRSQKILADAVSISRGSGMDLETVVSDLSNAYVGNNKGLKKYALGLSQAELKVASFDTVMKQFNRNFAGASDAYLSTYAGKMELLNTAADRAKETIGKGLVDALAKLSGGTSVQDAAKNLQSIADSINAITGAVAAMIGVVTKAYRIFDKIGTLGGLLPSTKEYEGFASKINAAEKKRLSILSHSARSSSPAGTWQRMQASKASEAAAKKRADALVNAQKSNTKELKKQAALKKAGTVFDLEQIQLVAALKGKLSEQDKLRAEAQLALLNGNDAVATKLTQQILASQDATGNLAELLRTLPDAKNPFQYLDAYLDGLKQKAASIGLGNGNVILDNAMTSGNTQVMPQTNAQDYSGFALNTSMPGTAGSGAQFGSSTPWAQAVQLYIDGKQVADALIGQSMSGTQAQIDRTLGAFDR